MKFKNLAIIISTVSLMYSCATATPVYVANTPQKENTQELKYEDFVNTLESTLKKEKEFNDAMNKGLDVVKKIKKEVPEWCYEWAIKYLASKDPAYFTNFDVEASELIEGLCNGSEENKIKTLKRK